MQINIIIFYVNNVFNMLIKNKSKMHLSFGGGAIHSGGIFGLQEGKRNVNSVWYLLIVIQVKIMSLC